MVGLAPRDATMARRVVNIRWTLYATILEGRLTAVEDN